MRGFFKKIVVMVCTCMLMCFCTACGPATEMTFTETNFSITLDSSFEKVVEKNLMYGYSNGEAGIGVANMSKDDIKKTGVQVTSLNRFAILMIKSYGAADNAMVRDGLNHSYCEFETTINGRNMKYYTAFYETGTNYWMVAFCCEPADYEKYQAKFANWASTVVVK